MIEIIVALISAATSIFVTLLKAREEQQKTPEILRPPSRWPEVEKKPRFKINWTGTLVPAIIFGAVGYFLGWSIPLIYEKIQDTNKPGPVPPITQVPTVSPVTPNAGEAQPYLQDVFFWWTLTGDLRTDAEGDKYLMSAFHSILVAMNVAQPEETMQAWIETAVDAAMGAGLCATKAQCDFLQFDTSGPFVALDTEESFRRLWEHVNGLSVNETTVQNMAAIRLALSALVGEPRQQELIGIWNDQLK